MQKTFDLSGYILIIVKEWKFILFNFFIACVLAIIYSFFLAKIQFVSSITFLPPFEDKSILSFLPGGTAGSIFSTDIVPQQITTIFESKAIRRRVIEKYNYYEKFKLTESPNKFEQTLRRLKKNLTLDIDEIGSLGITKHISYTINCFHASPDTCYEVVKYTFSLMDSVIKEVSVDRGRRNRMFIEKQLSLNMYLLDTLQEEFEEFQKKNKIFNVPSQIKLALDSYGHLKAKLLANEIKKKSLQKDYDNDYPLIIALGKENSVLRSKLMKMEKLSSPDVIIGLEKSTEMLPKYTNYLRDVEVQNKLILLLTQQLEEAKLKEARDISSLKVIDPPFIPEYKARPKRAYLAIGIVFIFMAFMFFVLFLQHFYSSFIKRSHLFYEIVNTFFKSKQ